MEATDNPPPRKRAIVACDVCRKRKRRCNGSRPRCRLCQDLNVECHYQEVLSSNHESRSASDHLIQRLERLENYLQQPPSLTPPSFQQSDVSNVDAISATSPMAQRQTSQALIPVDPTGSPVFSFPAITPSQDIQTTLCHDNDDQGRDTMSIPFGHSTTTGSLLHMPQTSTLLGLYPLDVFFRIEQRRLVPPELSLNIPSLPHQADSTLDRSITDALVGQYFSLVNSQHPILDASEFWKIYEQPSTNSVNHALCLIVLALAEASSQQPDTNMSAWMPGVQYFTPALSTILQHSLVSFGTGIVLPQSLYLAALYYSYLARPLLAWKLVHLASTNVQHLWIQYQDKSDQSESDPRYQSTIRLMWAIFILECDIIAEYHLPRSGIEHAVDRLPFPQCGDPPQQHMIFWLADLSARRLLNRVHHAMYHEPVKKVSSISRGAVDVPEHVHRAVSSYIGVSEELRRQLATWYDYLPRSIQPNLDDRHPTVDESILVLRYHAAGDIISRPFVFHVCSLPGGLEPPGFVLDNCKLCIHHCRKYLEIFGKRVDMPSGSTEITLHAALACMIILTLASLSPLLNQFISDLDELLEKSVRQIERWAFPGSSIETIYLIAKVLAMKQIAAKPL